MRFTAEQRWIIACLMAGAALIGVAYGNWLFEDVFDYEDVALWLCGFLGLFLVIGALLCARFLQALDARKNPR